MQVTLMMGLAFVLCNMDKVCPQQTKETICAARWHLLSWHMIQSRFCKQCHLCERQKELSVIRSPMALYGHKCCGCPKWMNEDIDCNCMEEMVAGYQCLSSLQR